MKRVFIFTLTLLILLGIFLSTNGILEKNNKTVSHVDYNSTLKAGLKQHDLTIDNIIDDISIEDYKVVFFGTNDYFSYAVIDNDNNSWQWNQTAPYYSIESDKLKIDYMPFKIEMPNKSNYYTIVIKKYDDAISSVEIIDSENGSNIYNFSSDYIVMSPTEDKNRIIKIFIYDSKGNEIER